MYKLSMPYHTAPGLLITFCGLDGCGKSSMIRYISEELAEYEPFLTEQPTAFVKAFEAFLPYTDPLRYSKSDRPNLSLLAAKDMLEHSNRVILPKLQEGKIVLCDGYFYTWLANLRARGYTGDGCIYEISKAIPRPDIAFFLDAPVEVALSRVRSRPYERNGHIDIALQESLRSKYREICLKNDGVLISTAQPIGDCYAKVKEAVLSALKAKGGSVFKKTEIVLARHEERLEHLEREIAMMKGVQNEIRSLNEILVLLAGELHHLSAAKHS